MIVENQIDQLISQLQSLKQTISNTSAKPAETTNEFNAVFENAMSIFNLEEVETQLNVETQLTLVDNSVDEHKAADPIPQWFDPDKPKAPSSMQLMEIMTGKSSSEVFQLSNFKDLNETANELIYGIIGSMPDRRDWNKILTSGNIVETLRMENAKLLQPQISVKTSFSNNGEPVASMIIISDHEGNPLRHIQGASEGLVETLRNFGITRQSIEKDLNGYRWNNIEERTQNQLLNSSAWA